MADTPPGEAARPTRALVVDDERMNRDLLVAMLGAGGYETVTAEDGEAAWEILDRDPDCVDVVLLDRRMPRLDGIGLTVRLKGDSRLASMPIIMQTAYASSEDVAEGIKAGVAYYLAKPLNRKVLMSVVAAAVEGHTRLRRLRDDLKKRTTALALLSTGSFRFRTIEEGNTLAVALARVAPSSRSLVIGLSEMFTNAVEHGNLGITYDEKARLVASGGWQSEVEARLNDPRYAARTVQVAFERVGGEIRFTIRDDGAGFDWRPYIDLSPERAFASHGRGIAIAARMAFDTVEYRAPGNEVVCVVKDSDAPPGPPSPGPPSPRPPPPGPPPPDARAGRGRWEDIELARQMQGQLLPAADDLLQVELGYGLRLSAVIEMSCDLGGDLWGFHPIDERRLAIYVADVSGHGVAAALNTFRLHAMIEHLRDVADRPGLMLGALNCQLVAHLPEGQYCAMVYAMVNADAGVVTYASAAMPAPLVAESAGAVRAGDGSGLPLGLTRDAAYDERTLPFPPGALLLMSSDGVTENPLEAGGSLGAHGLARLLAERAGEADTAEALLAPFLASARRPFRDDMVAVCCRHLAQRR